MTEGRGKSEKLLQRPCLLPPASGGGIPTLAEGCLAAGQGLSEPTTHPEESTTTRPPLVWPRPEGSGSRLPMEGSSGGRSQCGWPPCQAWPGAGLRLRERSPQVAGARDLGACRACQSGLGAGPSPVGGPHSPFPCPLLHHQPATGRRGGGGARPERAPRLGRRKSRTAQPGPGASLPTPAREALPVGGGHRGQSRAWGLWATTSPQSTSTSPPTIVSTLWTESPGAGGRGGGGRWQPGPGEAGSTALGELASGTHPPDSRPERSQPPPCRTTRTRTSVGAPWRASA